MRLHIIAGIASVATCWLSMTLTEALASSLPQDRSRQPQDSLHELFKRTDHSGKDDFHLSPKPDPSPVRYSIESPRLYLQQDEEYDEKPRINRHQEERSPLREVCDPNLTWGVRQKRRWCTLSHWLEKQRLLREAGLLQQTEHSPSNWNASPFRVSTISPEPSNFPTDRPEEAVTGASKEFHSPKIEPETSPSRASEPQLSPSRPPPGFSEKDRLTRQRSRRAAAQSAYGGIEAYARLESEDMDGTTFDKNIDSDKSDWKPSSSFSEGESADETLSEEAYDAPAQRNNLPFQAASSPPPTLSSLETNQEAAMSTCPLHNLQGSYSSESASRRVNGRRKRSRAFKSISRLQSESDAERKSVSVHSRHPFAPLRFRNTSSIPSTSSSKGPAQQRSRSKAKMPDKYDISKRDLSAFQRRLQRVAQNAEQILNGKLPPDPVPGRMLRPIDRWTAEMDAWWTGYVQARESAEGAGSRIKKIKGYLDVIRRCIKKRGGYVTIKDLARRHELMAARQREYFRNRWKELDPEKKAVLNEAKKQRKRQATARAKREAWEWAEERYKNEIGQGRERTNSRGDLANEST